MLARVLKHPRTDDDAQSNSNSMMNEDISAGGDEKRRRIHREIEQYRRAKFAKYIRMLAEFVPRCSVYHGDINLGQKRLKKLVVLKWTIQMLAQQFSTEQNSRQALFIQNSEFEQLLLQTLDSFAFAVNMATGQVVFVTQSVFSLLGVPSSVWLDDSIYHQLTLDSERDWQSLVSECSRPPGSGEVTCHFRTSDENGFRRFLVYGRAVKNDRGILICLAKLDPIIKLEPPEVTSFTTRHSFDAPNFTLTWSDEAMTALLGWSFGEFDQSIPFFKTLYPFSYDIHISHRLESIVDMKDEYDDVLIRGVTTTTKSGSARLLDLKISAIANPFSKKIHCLVCRHFLVNNSDSSGSKE